jgi:site-specific recombinase XerD
LLRHSAATAMLRAGASLQAVSSMLRHRSVDMTMHYAKVDLAMLAEVVQPWPEGVSC